MKLREFKIVLCILFMAIFNLKMFISVAPVFMSLNSKTVNAVITQLEQETKGEKESPEKDAAKEKKFCDEHFFSYTYEHVAIIEETNILHNQERSLYTQVYHPVVPTPPPNV
ncbi:hypothetical protein [Mucilaginibacter sp. KACC 22063]|uniref:hypothetical protein n=1 Tax=Mucilaginibacter sp. KACC 22063 TaxID=3025666 RepID=UPI002366F7AB|nr:hypothetical protein [Mucilaginibacter sp. KACC 22063]WDF54787.1 hypothetical protein PQ461_17800 [Mucilaginibacter sp. KACC 22063]